VDDLMNARQVARLLGLHENWVYDQAAAGNLPSYKFGGTRRFRRDDIDAWLAAHREGGERATATELPVPPVAPRRTRAATQAALFAE